jgi:hypothetical protein
MFFYSSVSFTFGDLFFLSFFLSLPIRLMVPPVADVTPASCQYPNPQYPSATHQANVIVPL